MNGAPVLHFGMCATAKRAVEVTFTGINTLELPMDLDRILELDGEALTAKLVLCGAPPEGVSAIEVAQTLRTQFPDAHLLLITDRSVQFAKKDLMKNGFNDVYYLPVDVGLLETDLKVCAETLGKLGLNLVPVKVHDLLDLENLDFPTYVYLPSNGRYVPFSGADEFSVQKREKLRAHGIQSVHIEQKSLPKFYEAFAEAMRRTKSSDTMSETQKRDVLKSIVRDLIGELFTDAASGMNTGLRLNKHCKDIVQAYVSASKSANGWHEKMMTVASGREEFYARSTTAMVAATLVAIGLGLPEKSVDALAVAGLLHHIGFARLPTDVVTKPAAELSADERTAFQRHPLVALEILKEKKVVLPELAYKIIQQQGERFDGRGFPSQLKGPQIAVEAQVLLLCQTLIERVEAATSTLSFKDAFSEFKRDLQNNPSDRPISQELLGQLTELFAEGPRPQSEDVSSGKWKMGQLA